ncbi:MAG: terminase [Bacteroidales bacterium]|nr:terminase [Bacteroidales bacterium]
MKSAERQNKIALAKTLFLQGMTSKDIAEKLSVSLNTISKWSVQQAWNSERAARNITRPMLVQKMLADLDKKISTGEWSPDAVCKAARAIEALDKQSNIVTVIEVFTAFTQWMTLRMKYDPELTSDFVKKVNFYHDKYINEKLSSTAIEN